MNLAPVFLGERLSLGSAPRLLGVGQDETFTVQVDFSSDKPVTPQQFFALVGAVQEELVPAETTVSFMPLTESTFRGVFKIPQSMLPPGTMLADVIPVGESATIEGITFTITGLSMVDEGSTPAPSPAPAPAPIEKKRLSTGAMIGIWTAIIGTGGTIFYLTTRKPKRRRRRAA